MATTRAGLERRVGGWRMLGVAVAGGLLAGFLAKWADESQIAWLADLGTFGALWLLIVVLIGWRTPNTTAAAVQGALFFLGLSLGYYAYSTFVLGFPGGELVVRWAALSLTAVPAMAAAVWWATRHSGLIPAGILAVVGALALYDGNTLPFWYIVTDGATTPGFPYRPVQAFVEIATALTATVVVPRNGRTRLMALLLLLPARIVVGRLIELAMRISPL